MSEVNVSVSVDEAHLDRISEVVQNLQSAGLNVKQSMEKLGIITGSCDRAKLQEISKVEGVSQVEPERKYQLAPPDSSVQ